MSSDPRLYTSRDLDEPEELRLCGGTVVVFTRRSPLKETGNEDAALLLELGSGHGLLAVADGVGGASAGEQASATALKHLARTIRHDMKQGRAVRESILSGFEAANAAVIELKLGAGTTLSVVEIEGRWVRSYHVGDSDVLVVGQRGKRKLKTIAHSPVGYAVEAGLIGEDEALHHAQRHVISNVIGDPGMRVEMSQRVRLADRDTLLAATDGVSDNISVDDLVERIRKGPLLKLARGLQSIVTERMNATAGSAPSKPDDMTFVLFRPGRAQR